MKLAGSRIAAAAPMKPATQPASLILRCFACGMLRQIDDDGRRVRLAKVHVAACTEGPGAKAESHLSLVSGDRLEVKLASGDVWFEIARGERGVPLNPEEAVALFYREWYAAVVKGPEGFASSFAGDATLLPPDSPPILGRDAIREWREHQARADFRVVPESVVQDEIRVEGPAAFVRTTVRGQRIPRAGGEGVAFEEKYLDLLRRTSDRGWEFVARMWNSNRT